MASKNLPLAQRETKPSSQPEIAAPQAKAHSAFAPQHTIALQRQERSNQTGLPDGLKNGVEQLSGISLDQVKVHYDSPEPEQIQAHAFARGTDIHLGPGQEHHLPHEAWHVVQQAQGRVKPTIMAKQKEANAEPWHEVQLRVNAALSEGSTAGVAINDSPELEREADLMGQKALQAATGGGATSAAVRRALSPASLQRKVPSVLQGVFTGYAGGGWALSNQALPGNLDVFPGGANNNAGGQQAGATARTINLASTNAYAAPQALGGFTFFSMQYGAKILYQPGGKPKRYTHLHVINGKTHGPGTPNNLTLGSTADNNHHRADVEDPIRTGLPGADTVTAYDAALAANPTNFFHNGIAYWTNPKLPAVPGSQAAAKGAKVKVGGVYKNYVRSANPAAPTKDRHWVEYQVDPDYTGPLSPTIRSNMSKVYKQRHEDEMDDLDLNQVSLLAPGKRAAARAQLQFGIAALNLIVTAGNLAGGVAANLLAGNNAAYPFAVAAVGVNKAKGYKKQMATERTDMTNFGDWALEAFPVSLDCDADFYRASFDPANPWYKRTEPQENVITNQN